MLQGAEMTMEAERMTAKELDFWTLRSHRMAAEAASKGLLKDSIVPVNG